uniref:Centromere protein K n=1 Tax=Malurus cyaneus samueli TaxID=2593467 RepID=A0A8C5TRR1_9PASS
MEHWCCRHFLLSHSSAEQLMCLLHNMLLMKLSILLSSLQKIKNDLEMVLSTVRSKNKQLDEDLKSLKGKGFDELENKMLKLKTYKKELLSALGEFLDEHFPPPERGENTKKKMLINKLITTPHEPYVTINESFWPPYIELLLRTGTALRHQEDPNRIRLEAFHK